MYQFSTITSADYYPFVLVLFDSLKRFNDNVKLHVLVTSENVDTLKAEEGIHLYSLSSVESIPLGKEIILKYLENDNFLRWALKPIFLQKVLQTSESVIYLDNDLYFFNNYDFLFELLEQHSLLLSPHHGSILPWHYPDEFMINFQIGLYNGGFVGVRKESIDTLKWWANVCFYKMSTAHEEGLFVDQRFLDLVPIIDKNAGLLHHRGCNLGSWNIHECKRLVIDKSVMINGIFPVIFIHFNNETIKQILNGNDQILFPYYREYEENFSSRGFSLQEFKNHYRTTDQITRLKRKIKIRTRIKSILIKLAQKL